MSHGLRALKGQSYHSIEIDARDARLAFGIGSGRAPGVQLFESLDQYKTKTAKGTIPILWDVKEGIPTEGLTVFRPEIGTRGAIELVLHEDTYQALRDDDPRARFTLMHELGHVFLHAEDLVERGRLPHYGASFRRVGAHARTHPTAFDTEFQANAWAAAFLMPARELIDLEKRGTLRGSVVDRWFGVSAESAKYRLQTYQDRKGELTR